MSLIRRLEYNFSFNCSSNWLAGGGTGAGVAAGAGIRFLTGGPIGAINGAGYGTYFGASNGANVGKILGIALEKMDEHKKYSSKLIHAT